MLALLAKIREEVNSPNNIYASEARLAYYDDAKQSALNFETQMQLAMKKAMTLLEFGDEEKAVAFMENILNTSLKYPNARKGALDALGLAYLRLGERTNCINNHNADACIMPIQGDGIYPIQDPTRKAINTFQRLLRDDDPNNMDAIWLLNVAYMSIGEYPDRVPKKWLIPRLNEQGVVKVKPFTEIATDLGLAVKNRSGGVIVDDFDNDGYLDIINSAWGMDDPLHFFKNNGDGTFTDRSEESGLAPFTGGLNMVQADYNNDGWVDFLVLRGAWQGVSGFGKQPNSLFRNNGDGTFTDVTFDSGILSLMPTQTATWNDFNRDGWLDLFIGNETAPVGEKYPCELYINNQDGTFTNVAPGTNLSIQEFVKAVVSADYDKDGWPDIFISTLNGPKILLHNKGVSGPGVAFENVSANAGFAKDTSHTFPTGFFDYDNDGWLDLFLCKYDFDKDLSYYMAEEALKPQAERSGKMMIYRNNQDGTFKDVSKKVGFDKSVFGMAVNFGDIDNDGYLDLYCSTGNPSYKSIIPNKLYKNMNGEKFADVTVSARVGNIQKGHAVSFADLNNNGDLDIFVDYGGAYRGDYYHSALYLNPGQSDNNWISIQLEGTKSNRSAIGAKITLKVSDNAGKRTIYREMNSGASFGCSPLRAQIGIGKAQIIEEITVQWPSGINTIKLNNIQPNQMIRIKEGVEGFMEIPLKNIVFKKLDGSIPMCAPLKGALNE
ncbi:MAG: CRTAC1 family protein [Saprospiraceae bacterium]